MKLLQVPTAILDERIKKNWKKILHSNFPKMDTRTIMKVRMNLVKKPEQKIIQKVS
jgi:hypothetical protein